MAANLIQFPALTARKSLCHDEPSCIQTERIAVLEEKARSAREERLAVRGHLGRIENKIDRMQRWMLRLAVSAFGLSVTTLLSVLLALVLKVKP